jgi:hypothetical protein
MGGGARAEGTQAAGRGVQSAPIAGIARDRKTRSSPLMNTDNTDQEIGLGMVCDEVE